MPNVLDIEPLRAYARRVGAKIGDERIAARFERLAVAHLLQDERNFRPAADMDLERAPDWARDVRERGEAIHVFSLRRGGGQGLHNLARGLAAARQLAATPCEERPNDVFIITAAREFLDKIERASFETARRKGLDFARVLKSWADTLDARHVCAPQIIPSNGRCWVRVTSVNNLRAVGAEFRNCLARTSRASGYGYGLMRGAKQFWVLRDAGGLGHIVAMMDGPQATGFIEVRGPRNARIANEHPDLTRLALALGMRPPTPPPSSPIDFAALLLTRLPCRCQLCAPRLPTPAPPLRHAAASP